jgi:hypothetical protein
MPEKKCGLILAVATVLTCEQVRTGTRHRCPINALNLSAVIVTVKPYLIRVHRWEFEKNLLLQINNELPFLPGFGLTANNLAAT